MKKISIILLLSGLCFLSSCGKEEDTTKNLAEMKNCRELVFLHNDNNGKPETVFNRITEQEKIDRILLAMKNPEPYAPVLPPMLIYSIRGVGKHGAIRQVQCTWSDDAKSVLFEESQSKEVYQLFVEYGIIDPSAPVIIGHPDFTEQEKEDYERAKDRD